MRQRRVQLAFLVAGLLLAMGACAPAAPSPSPIAKSPQSGPAAVPTPSPKPKALETIRFGQIAPHLVYWDMYAGQAKGFFALSDSASKLFSRLSPPKEFC